jgi:tripartite-type tricarboxylate transporter receptor subunit TctC
MKTLIFAILAAVCFTTQATEFTVHHAPGGPSDRATRAIVKHLPGDYLAVNRPGAGGRIAMRHVLKNDAMVLATMGQIYVTNTLAEVEAGYSLADLEILGTAGTMPNVLACRRSLNITKVKDLEGKSFNFGVAGYGSSEHIATEALFVRIKGNHVVIPYSQGGATSIFDMLGGNLDCMFANYPTIRPFVNDERLTVLMTSHDLGLNVPTWRDSYGESFPFQSYLSVIVSKQLDADIKRRIAKDLAEAFAKEELRSELKNIGLFVVARTDAQSTRQVEDAMQRLRQFIVNSKIKIQ